jgi:outer membrane protein assembly factor BamB
MCSLHRSCLLLRLIYGMVAAWCFGGSGLEAGNWPNWRGPFFNGSADETAPLPDHWNKTENECWVVPMPGKSGATPIIWSDFVFVASPDKEKNLLLLCLDAVSGKERWRQVVGQGDQDYDKNNMAAPSPTTDGKTVVAMFGTGEIAAYDFAGQARWKRNLAKEFGKFAIGYYYASSPVLYEGRLYVQVLQRSEPRTYPHSTDDKPHRDSFLLCLDPLTGKELWRQIRETEANGEAQEAYTTPFPFHGSHGTEIVVYGAGYLTSHDPVTGKEFWRCGSLNPDRSSLWRTICSAVPGTGLIYACVPRVTSPMLAVKPDGSGALSPKTQVAWTMEKDSSDVSTPLLYQGRLYVLDSGRRVMTCLDPKTGERKWRGEFGGREFFSASPTGADGKIYCIGEGGTVVVLAAGDAFKILAQFKMEGEGGDFELSGGHSAPVLSSIAVAGGHLYVRTPVKLHCIGAKP